MMSQRLEVCLICLLTFTLILVMCVVYLADVDIRSADSKTADVLKECVPTENQDTADKLPADDDTNSSGPRASPTLQLVIATSRHGNRAPLVSFPSELEVLNDPVWQNGPRELTKVGRTQMYNLGKKFRSLYNRFLKQHYFPEDFEAYSTLKDRTLMSAELFLAGLFPPRDFQVWDKHLPWQPVPVYPTYLDHTDMVQTDATICPRFEEEKQNVLAHYYTENVDATVSALAEYLRNRTGSTLKLHYTLAVAWDYLTCLDTEGRPLPSWAHSVYPTPLEELSTTIFKLNTIGTDTMTRLFEGTLFKEMIDFMEASANGTSPDKRMVYYSTHDFTIWGLLGILGLREVPGSNMVATGSALIIELHQDLQTSDHYVKVLYVNGDALDIEPITVTIPECGDPCRLDHLINITRKYTDIDDWNAECQLEYENSS